MQGKDTGKQGVDSTFVLPLVCKSLNGSIHPAQTVKQTEC